MPSVTTDGTLRRELQVLAFDLYDTLLDRESKLVPAIDDYFGTVGHDGDPDMLAAVEPAFETELDGVISVAEAGAYKPHPALYRLLCERFDVAPHEVAFVSAHTFDIVGAKAVGMRGAFVNRHDNPYGGWPHRPDVPVKDPEGLADALA